eukprot:15328594-Ditylum_brightwellii.AAC.1
MEDSSNNDGCTTDNENDDEEASDTEVTTESNEKEREKRRVARNLLTLSLIAGINIQTYAELAPGMTGDGMDPYWKIDQLLERFNDHYRRKFEHGWKVTVDKRIFWGYMQNQSGGGHKCEHKPQGFGQEYKCVSDVGINVTTTLGHVQSKQINDQLA